MNGKELPPLPAPVPCGWDSVNAELCWRFTDFMLFHSQKLSLKSGLCSPLCSEEMEAQGLNYFCALRGGTVTQLLGPVRQNPHSAGAAGGAQQVFNAQTRSCDLRPI